MANLASDIEGAEKHAYSPFHALDLISIHPEMTTPILGGSYYKVTHLHSRALWAFNARHDEGRFDDTKSHGAESHSFRNNSISCQPFTNLFVVT